MKSYTCHICGYETTVADDAEIKFCGKCGAEAVFDKESAAETIVNEEIATEESDKPGISTVLTSLAIIECCVAFILFIAFVTASVGQALLYAVAVLIAALFTYAFGEVINLLHKSVSIQTKILEKMESEKKDSE